MASGSAAIPSSASARVACSRSATGQARIQTRPVTVPTYTPDLPVETEPAPDPLDAIRQFVRRRRVEPTEGMPRFTGGAVGAISYDAVSAFETTVPLPDRDPIGVPTASFIETDLVLVFDHLTHTLSAIASLHTDAPDLEGRYRIAETAVFEALERTARPSAAELAGPPTRTNGTATLAGPIDTSLGREEYIHAVEVAKDAIAAGEAIQVVLARRQSFELPTRPVDRPPARRHRPLPVASAGSTPARTCSSCGRRSSRSSAPRRSCCSRRRATSSRPTRSPAPARAARTPARTSSSPSSSRRTRRSVPSTSCSSTSGATTSGV